MNNFDEKDHPRDSDGKFTDGNGQSKRDKTIAAVRKYSDDPKRDMEYSNLPNAKRIADRIPQSVWKNKVQESDDVVKVNLDSDIQKQFDRATPKERQKLAYRYIMDNLTGKYTARDGREVSISSVGADKITHRSIDVKLRVSPELAALIKTGKLVGVVDVEHKRFARMAYYKTIFQIGNDKYVGLLNVGIRPNGDSTLYDLNPFDKQ